MSEPSTETVFDVDTLAVREGEARASLRSWLRLNPSYTYQSFLDRLPEPTDKSTVSIWLNGRLSAATSRKAQLLMEAAEELMIAPTGDKIIVEERYDREPRDDDERYLMNLVHELRELSRRLGERFPVRLVSMAGKYAVPARNLIARDRTAGCGNVLSYMHDGMEYATAETISEPALRLACERSNMLREAGLEALKFYEGGDRDYAEARFFNYDGSLRARAALVLRDAQMLEAAMPDLIRSLDFPARSIDGIHVNLVEVLDLALRGDFARAAHWSGVAVALARDERHARMFRHALAERSAPHLKEHWSTIAPGLAGEELSE